MLFLAIAFLISDAIKSNKSIRSIPKEQKSVIIAQNITFLRADENQTIYRGFVEKAKKEQNKETLYACTVQSGDDKNRSLYAPIIENFESEALFEQGFVFKSIDGMLKTGNAVYEKKNELLKGDKGFEIESKLLDATGKRFVYNIKDKSLEADSIKANFDNKAGL